MADKSVAAYSPPSDSDIMFQLYMFVGYDSPIYYIDGQVDFNYGEKFRNDYDLGYSQTQDPNELTHFNGYLNMGPASLRAPISITEGSGAQWKNFGYIKNRYLSISGSSVNFGAGVPGASGTIGESFDGSAVGLTGSLDYNQGGTRLFYTADLNLPPPAATQGIQNYMVVGYIKNVKYIVTRNGAHYQPGGNGPVPGRDLIGNRLPMGMMFPLYFPHRDTLVLKRDNNSKWQGTNTYVHMLDIE